jgi:hypothetical protein
MAFWIWYAVAIWAVGVLAFIIRISYFLITMLDNLDPDADQWSGFFNAGARFDPSRLNPTGQAFRLRLRRLLWIAAAYGLGGLLLIVGVASLIAKRLS